jgi:hypothetical protein
MIKIRQKESAMTRAVTTFQIPAKIISNGNAIEAWLNCHQPTILDSTTVRAALRESPSLLEYDENGDIGRYVFALGDRAVLANTAMLARQAGFVIDETPEGWTAIEPMSSFWDEEPGAHMRWSAEISEFDAGMGPFPALWIVYSEVTDTDDIEDCQGVNGWRVKVAKTRDALKISYIHS